MLISLFLFSSLLKVESCWLINEVKQTNYKHIVLFNWVEDFSVCFKGVKKWTYHLISVFFLTSKLNWLISNRNKVTRTWPVFYFTGLFRKQVKQLLKLINPKKTTLNRAFSKAHETLQYTHYHKHENSKTQKIVKKLKLKSKLAKT